MTSLEEILIPYLRVPQEIEKIMSKLDELKDSVANMKTTISDEAVELKAIKDQLQSMIDSKAGFIDPNDLQPIIDDLATSTSNIEALSDFGGQAAGSGDTTGGTEPAPSDLPPAGGVEEPQVPTEDSPTDTGFEPAPSEEPATGTEDVPVSEPTGENGGGDVPSNEPGPAQPAEEPEVPVEEPATGGDESSDEGSGF